MLDEPALGAALHEVLHQARVESEQLAVGGGAGVAEQFDRLVVAADLYSDLGEDAVGMLLDQVQAVLAEQVVVGDPAFQA